MHIGTDEVGVIRIYRVLLVSYVYKDFLIENTDLYYLYN